MIIQLFLFDLKYPMFYLIKNKMSKCTREKHFQNENYDQIVSLQNGNVLMRYMTDENKTKYINTMNCNNSKEQMLQFTIY